MTLGLLAFSQPAGASDEPAMTVAINVQPKGSGPRSVGSVDSCVSAEVGQQVSVDIALPDPGVPVDRGISAYQFSMIYDPDVVWVQADDHNQLLAQGHGSSIIQLSDPKPDTNGIYVSWAVDFGPAGIEPEGSSETGPGVIARLTLLPRSAGQASLALREVLLLDDKSNPINVGSVSGASLYVGAPCPSDSSPAPSPAVTSALTPVPPDPSPSSGTTSGPVIAALALTGGPPGDGGSASSAWLLVAGAVAMLAGAVMVVAGGRLRTRR
ncbi:MAG: hypothetical protein AAB092_05290 [Chloroflexota bacterium]